MKGAPQVALVVAVGLVACAQPARDREGDEPSRDLVASFRTCGTTPVDLLLVIDTSPSMADEREHLIEQVELMAREMISPSSPDDPGIHDLRVGVVTADVEDPSTDGVLRDTGDGPGCARAYSARDCDRDAGCPWLSHRLFEPDDGTDSSDPPLWDDLACIVGALGTGGSAVERPLEAAVAALTTRAGPGLPNHGFLREDSLLGILIITDEDDCSGLDSVENSEPGIGCIAHEDELTSVAEFYDALVELRGGDLNRIVVSVIGGLPLDGSWWPGDPIEELHGLRRIVSGEQQPSCDSDMALAYLPPRLVELVYSFGNNGVLESICCEDWMPALQALTRHILPRVPPVCVSRPLPHDAASSCEATMVIYDSTECAGLADLAGPGRSEGWSVDLGLDAEGKRLCRILPADLDGDACPDGAAQCPPTWVDMGVPWCGREWDSGGEGLDGWLIDHSDPECELGELRFTDHLITAASALVRLECIE